MSRSSSCPNLEPQKWACPLAPASWCSSSSAMRGPPRSARYQPSTIEVRVLEEGTGGAEPHKLVASPKLRHQISHTTFPVGSGRRLRLLGNFPPFRNHSTGTHRWERRDDGGQMEQKVPTELRRHFETKKWCRRLRVINGSLDYRVTYSQGGTGQKMIWEHSQWLWPLGWFDG